jgi:hypothetical protein
LPVAAARLILVATTSALAVSRGEEYRAQPDGEQELTLHDILLVHFESWGKRAWMLKRRWWVASCAYRGF